MSKSDIGERTALRLCRNVAHAVKDAIEPLVGEEEGARKLYMGADGTPTHKIDDVAERGAFEEFQTWDFPVRVISEEAGERRFGGSPEFTVLLDPVDGTTNAIEGIPFYTVSIGIGDRILSDIWFGYVYDLAHDVEYYAFMGGGAYAVRKSNEIPINVSTVADLDLSDLSLYGFSQRPLEISNLAKRAKRLRIFGCSSLEMCYVGAGILDGFVDVRGYLRMMDIGGAYLIVKEAGGVVTDEEGREHRGVFDVKAKVNMIASNPFIHHQIIDMLG